MPRLVWKRAAAIFVLRAFRLGFPKVGEGASKGEYANLDLKRLYWPYA